MANFEFASIVRGMNSVAHADEHTAALAVPEIFEGVDTTIREADVLAFGMVVIEVCLRTFPHLVLKVDR